MNQTSTWILLLFICLSASLSAQVPNDSCETAIDIQGVFSDGPFVCIDGNSLTALPEEENNTCAIGDFPTVWYRIATDGNATLINISVESEDFDSPTITVFHQLSDCDNLQQIPLTQSNLPCIVGSGGEAEAIGSDVGASEIYYIAISSLNSVGGEFEICVNTISVASACVMDRDIEITYRSSGGPLEGPFFPGDTVGVCFNVNSFSPINNGCQWFQGMVPVFGNGWDPASFDGNGQPLNATINNLVMGEPYNGVYGTSTWDWFTDVGYHHSNVFYQIADIDGNGTVDMCSILYDPDCPDVGGIIGGCCGPCWDNAGDILPPGWFAYGVNGSCATPGPPISVDWGDGNSCTSSMGPWSICFDLIVRDYPDCLEDPSTQDLSLGFYTFADGEVGSWTGGASACALDQPTKLTLPFCCTELAEDFTALPTACGQSIMNVTLDEPGVEYWTWSVDITGQVSGTSEGEGGPGTNVIDTLVNLGSTTALIEYIFFGIGGAGCPIFEYTVELEITSDVEASLHTPPTCSGLPADFIITSQVEGGSGNYSYLWLPGGETTPSILVPNPTEGAQYSVIVSDGAYCVDTAMITLQLDSTLSVDIIAPVTETCESNAPITLNGTVNGSSGAAYLFEWTLANGENQISDIIDANEPGTYYLSVVDTSGCMGQDSVDILFFEDPIAVIESTSGNLGFCSGDTINLNANVSEGQPPYSITWTTPQGNYSGTTVSVYTEGVYSVEIEDSNGCLATDEVTVSENDLPVVDFGTDTIFTIDPVFLDAGPGYDWYAWSTGSTQQVIQIVGPACVSVTVSDANGCIGSGSVCVEFITDVIDLNAAGVLRIFPNPNKGVFTISGDIQANSTFSIEIYNAIGQRVQQINPMIETSKINKEIVLEDPAPGIYFVKVKIDKEVFVGRIIVE